MMKVVAFNGSARKDGNTAILIKTVLGELESEGIATELVQLAGSRLRGCTACGVCFEKKNQRCVVNEDILNACLENMLEADGIILGSPTYFADVSAEMKALIDRAGFVARANDDMFRRKVGAAVVAVRMTAPSMRSHDEPLFHDQPDDHSRSRYWNIGFGLRPAGEDDAEGLDTMRTLSRNMAWLPKKLHA